jgi:hypothetical protein
MVFLKNQDLTLGCLPEIYLTDKSHTDWKWTNEIHKQWGEDTLIANKTKLVRRYKEGHYILVKGIIYQESDIINICALHISIPSFIKQTLPYIKGQILIK